MKKTIGLLILLVAIAANISFATDVSGTISADAVWDIAGSPYKVTNTVTVNSGVTLTINPGVRVEFNGDYSLAVYGTLNALGSGDLTDHIVLTKYISYSGNWRFIQFNPGATGVLSYCDISYGGSSTGSIYLNGTLDDVNISNCTISNSLTSGITLVNVANPSITNCSFTGNVKGINWAVSSLGTVNNCTFTGNSDYPLDIPVNMVGRLNGITISGNTNGDSIYVRGGTITETEKRWQNFNVPYIIGGTVSVGVGMVNIIDPGTKLKFASNLTHFYVYGKLLAQGTVSQHIVFTSSKAVPAAGDWGMLYFTPQSTVTPEGILDYCDISYGGYSNTSLNFNSTLDKVNISNCTVSNSKTIGINHYNNSYPTISNCNVNNSGTNGVSVNSGGGPNIINCNISNSGMGGTPSDGIYIAANAKANITGSTVSNSKYGINWASANIGSIANCNITGCDRGISITSNVALKPRYCNFSQNDTGVYVNVASTTVKPDFGTVTDPGYNKIKDNFNFNFYNNSNTVYGAINAIGNDWGLYTASAIDGTIWDDDEGAFGQVIFEPFLGPLWSDVNYATANVNGKKLARESGSDNNLHLTFQRKGKICYSNSIDAGASWMSAVELADPGYAWDPCIALNASEEPCIAYPMAKESYTTGLQFASYDGSNWQFAPVIPQTHMVGGFNVSPASMTIDASDIVHLAVETSQGTPDGYWWFLWYYKFEANNPSAPVIVKLDEMFVMDEPYLKSPSIARDGSGNCHIAYSKRQVTINPGDVYYAEQISDGSWKPIINLSQSETPSSEASIDVYGGKVYATWTELEDVGSQVYRRAKDLTGGWYDPAPCSEIGTNGSIEAYTPSCASGIAMWTENIDNANYAVKYLRPDVGATVQTLSASTNLLSYPHGALALDGSTLRGAWTEVISGGEYGPWISEVKSTSGTGKKVAYLEVLAGTVTPSVYTTTRDGYIVYPSGVSVDYAASELTYILPYLIPGNDYTVQIVGYHESSSTWNEQVKLDGKEAKVLKVKAHVPETLLVNIPAGYYASDKQITLTVKKLTGDYAAIASIAVYQTEKAIVGKLGGAQTAANSEYGIQNIEFMLQPSFPNPAKQLTTINYQLPKAGQASLKVYNIQGQLVKTLVDGVKPAGIHSVAWDCKNNEGKQVSNGIYLYRLNTKENTETKKITILK